MSNDVLLRSVVTCGECRADTLVVALAENNPGAPPCEFRQMNWTEGTATRCRLIFKHDGECLFDGPWSASVFAEDTVAPGFTGDDYRSYAEGLSAAERDGSPGRRPR